MGRLGVGAIYDRNIIRVHCTGNTCILVLLEQPFVQGSVGVSLTFQDVVLYFLVSCIQNASFCFVHLVFQQHFLLQRSLISRLQRLFDDVGSLILFLHRSDQFAP